MIPDTKFVNLHTHSWYSILEAAMSPQQLLESAEKLGCPAVALTDVSAGYGLVEFFQKAKGGTVKSILGVEMAIATDSRFEKRAGIDGREGHLVLLAKNLVGWKNLLFLISQASLEGMYYKPRVDWELLQSRSEGLLVLSGGTAGLIGRSFRDFGEKRAQQVLEKIQKIFGIENVYLEFIARDYPEQQELNAFFVTLAEKTGTPTVASSDARYAVAEDEEACDTLVCIGKNQQVNDPGRFKFAERNWFKSWEEICKDLSNVPDEILEQSRKNTLVVADLINLELQFNQSLLPNFDVPEGESEASHLRNNCEKMISKLYPNADMKYKKVIQDRLDYELSIIGSMGFEAYFLIVQDFIDFAREKGIAVGPGRGSAAGSLVSFLLQITTIDPLGYELLFERFLNPERISMTDIDIDFSDERRHEVLQYVTEKYGVEKVSKVCTFGTLAAKAAIKDVGRAQGVPYSDMNAFTKLLPTKPGLTLDDALSFPDFKTKLDANASLKKVFDVAKKLEGCVRHVGVHACAVIIGHDDLRENSPLQWAPGADAVKITQFPYQQLESIGLLKMDFLGLRNLSILERAVQHIKQTCNQEVDLSQIPIDDALTFEKVFAVGETTGVFQFESSGMRRYLKELKPTEFEDLVAMNALYRPGPMEYIPTYIAGKHGTEEVKFLDPVLEPILKKTYGIAVYQEQIMRIAQDFAGFSLGQADILRKAIGKKKIKLLEEQRIKFLEGAVKMKRTKKTAEKMFDDIIVPFAGYGFNRSHAVCYARIAYETAYLRAHYPEEFMAAMMTTDRNNTDRIVMEMNECNTMEMEVLPPSVNESGSHFTVIVPNTETGLFDSVSPDKTGLDNEKNKKKIRFGLSAIKGLGEETVNQIIAERNSGGDFISLQDFAERVPSKLVNKKTLEALGFSGAFDVFGNRKAVVDSLEDLSSFAREFQDKKDAGQMGLFGGTDSSAVKFTLRDGEATKDDILRWERESLGLYVSEHPLKGMSRYFEKFGRLIHSFSEEDLGKQVVIHGLVTDVRRILTRRGKNMAVLTIEDTSGKMELAVFPMIFEKTSSAVFEVDAFVRIRGKIEERDGSFNCIAEELRVGDLAKIQSVHVFADVDEKSETPFEFTIPSYATTGQVDAIKKIIRERKSDAGYAREFILKLGKNSVKVPFLVDISVHLESELKAVFTEEK
jgi:DNA polymerase III subunit alpha